MSWGGIKRTAADKWFSEAVRASTPICEICGWRPSNQVAHIKGRRNHAIRYCRDNVLASCTECHRKMGENPTDFTQWLEATHPGRLDRINLKARGILKNTEANRKLVSAHYREQLRLIRADPTHTLESWN